MEFVFKKNPFPISHGFYVTSKISCLNCSNFIKNNNTAFSCAQNLQYSLTNVFLRDGRCSRQTMYIKKPFAADTLQPRRYFLQDSSSLLTFRTNNYFWTSSINTSLFLKHFSSEENSSTTFPQILLIQETKYFKRNCQQVQISLVLQQLKLRLMQISF